MADLVVLGGGAAGFFGAIRAAEEAPHARVLLLEAAARPLQKVRISGGGRCNVTHRPLEVADLVSHYPRGARELRSVFSRFGPADTIEWFERRGVRLKTEPDGRVFPATGDSRTIVECLLSAASAAGVELRLHATVREAVAAPDPPGALDLLLSDGARVRAEALLVATGSNPQGLALARSLGHALVPPVPSLFTFAVRDPRLDGLAGVALERVRARLRVPEATTEHEQEGSLLITHWGVSAFAILRLSAWAARDLHASGYRATLELDLVPRLDEVALRAAMESLRREHPRAAIVHHGPAPDVPRRLWERLAAAAGARPETRWNDASRPLIHRLVEELKRGAYAVSGQGPFKEEFVTAGGVARTEVDWRTMESKRARGLFLAGEALDADGLTGGFNFQSAWSTGWLAGTAMAERARRPSSLAGESPHGS